MTWDTIFGLGSYDYFNLTDDEIAVDHEFDRKLYPPCTSNALGYFTLNKLVAHNENELKTIILGSNRQKDYFSVKLEFPCNTAFLARCGFPKGQIRYNEARNLVFYKK